VAREAFEAGVHAKMECTDCHRREEGAFDQVPHESRGSVPPTCIRCHGLNLKELKYEFHESVHAVRMPGEFGCGECHDAHSMPRARGKLGREARTELANRSCLRCHRDADFRIAARHDGKNPPSNTHEWLPNLDKHARMRCVVCHTAIEGDHDHNILAKEQATRSCEASHAKDAPLVRKYVGEEERRGWITNPLVFREAYLPGTVRNRLADGIVLALFALTFIGAVGHGLLRVLTRARRAEPPFEVESTYMYPLGLRIWHWTNALLMILLAITGLRVHFGGQEDPILSFEAAFHIHNLAGVLLVFFGLAYFFRNAVTRNARQYIRKPQDGMKGLLKQARFYLYGIFRGEPHPYHATPERKFNSLQQITYAGVMYLLFPILIVTGIILFFPRMLPDKIGDLPGVWWFATIHYLSAAAVIVFLLAHIYLATMGDRVGYLLSAMFTGRHRQHVPKRHEGAAAAGGESVPE
jgi:thiosulfate reductase cytochrome b subunit